jgi:hypothetical protein
MIDYAHHWRRGGGVGTLGAVCYDTYPVPLSVLRTMTFWCGSGSGSADMPLINGSGFRSGSASGFGSGSFYFHH